MKSRPRPTPGGATVVRGRVTGSGPVSIEPGTLIGGAKRLVGITAGSRAMLEQPVRFVEVSGIRPTIDRVFPFDEAPAAYSHLAAGQHFGKTVIEISA
ncbi:zinc-binding dehydrogenase [Mesorhizobium kowhaii]|uniref:zinc-binding dehydrogenase n=1 Tax=Mesorhizobium kowhaii TaxID=1300272 RepID=UPI0035E8FA1E